VGGAQGRLSKTHSRLGPAVGEPGRRRRQTIQSLTQRLAEFAVDPAHGELSDGVVHAARRAILDSVGVSVAGTRHAAWQKAVDMVRELKAGGECRLIGSVERTDPINAALVNGIAAHVLDWDDTILPTRAHLSAALLPALVATGETRGRSLTDIIPAFVIGFELQARLNHAIYPSVHLRGWQGTGIVGGIGTAAAVGRMLKLTPRQIAHAIGIAATNASGLIATFGSMSKPLNIGRAGASGLQSAFLAALDFTSHEDVLGEGRFLELYADAPRHDLLLDGLGTEWSILRNGYKPYPCGFVAHAMIDAVRELRAKGGGTRRLRRLALRVSPESVHLMGNRDPTNELEAKFSLAYDAAVAWSDGHVTPAAFEDEAVRAPRYRSIMALTEITASADIAQHEALAEAEFEDGSVERVHVEHARGTPARPMSDTDLFEKFSAALAMGGIADAPTLRTLIMDEPDVPVSVLMDHLSPAGLADAPASRHAAVGG
jgi:2-methylcitrate dehydratase PrpD